MNFVFHTSPKTSLLVPGDPGRLFTHIYIETVEASRPVGTRHANVRSYCGNLKKVCVRILYLRIGAVI